MVLQQLDRLFSEGTLAGLGDGQLLERYLTRRDEVAFETLVELHGPMVLGVCRRFLRDPRDIEDAFQATFLILVRKAPGIRDGKSSVELALRRGASGCNAGSGQLAAPARSGAGHRRRGIRGQAREPGHVLESDRCSIRS